MQRALVTDTHFVTGRRMTSIIIVALLVSLVLAMAPAARAQESTPEAATPEATPAATPAAGATPSAQTDVLGDVLMTYDFDAMPQAPMTVRLLRITLAPGASVPMHTHPGPEFDLVESGTLTARVDGTAVVSVDGEQSEVTEPQTLSAGSWIMYPDGVGMNLANEGDEELVLLSAVILSVGGENQSTITYTEGEPTDSDFDGVSFVVLGDGLIQQFPDGPTTVTVDQLTLDPGESIPPFTGAALVSKASGGLSFTAVEGQVQVTRTDNPQLQPNAIPGQEFTLENNDAAFFPAGYEAVDRPDSTDELSLLRLLIQPEGELANAAAVVSPVTDVAIA
ncbi:MAG TPA: cupin domain-containing protein, partial [Thermomicrobiales bacterium]|nr:cupin domain-containing protein [Thermomicrobiales bacterium]